MIKPTKYKSIPVQSLLNRETAIVSIEDKAKITTITNKLMELIKIKHAQCMNVISYLLNDVNCIIKPSSLLMELGF